MWQGGVFLPYPTTFAWGDTEELEKAIGMLSEVKESIINAYERKTKLSRVKLSHLMDDETWFNAKKAVELGFADQIMFWKPDESAPVNEGAIFSKMAVVNSFMSKLPRKEKGTDITTLDKRLDLLKF